MLHPVRFGLPKLLLVDDRPANLLALEATLGDGDYQLLKATSGAQALALLDEHPDVALILLDVQMPGMDGFEVSRQIKAAPALRDIPIIFVTAIYTEDPFVRKGYQAGAIDYFSKPFDPEILKLKVGIYAAFRQRTAMLKERERQLTESEELLRTGRKLSAALESLPVGVIVTDREGRVAQTNDEVLKILKSVERTHSDGYAEFLGWWDVDGNLLRKNMGPLLRALDGHGSHSEIVRIKCPDQSSKAVFVSASALRGIGGQVEGAVVVIQDVTEHQKIEADIEQRIIHLVSLGVQLQESAPALAK